MGMNDFKYWIRNQASMPPEPPSTTLLQFSVVKLSQRQMSRTCNAIIAHGATFYGATLCYISDFQNSVPTPASWEGFAHVRRSTGIRAITWTSQAAGAIYMLKIEAGATWEASETPTVKRLNTMSLRSSLWYHSPWKWAGDPRQDHNQCTKAIHTEMICKRDDRE